MNGKHLTVATAAGVLAAIAGVYGSAAALGIFVDRPAWHSEQLVLIDAINQLKANLDGWKLEALRDELDRLELKVATIRAAGEKPNDLDILRIKQLDRKIRELEKGISQ